MRKTNLSDGFGHRADAAPRGSSAVKLDQDAPPAAPPKVWLYIADGRESKDLSTLDAIGYEEWGANRNTRKGDLILMYRTAPYSDIAYVFVAAGDAYPTEQSRNWEWKWGIKITGGYRLPRAITRKELRSE